MAVTLNRTLKDLRNTRDLRSEILGLASKLANEGSTARLIVEDPLVSSNTVEEEWKAAMKVLAPSVSERMTIEIQKADAPGRPAGFTIETGIFPLERPNFRYEVLRLLVAASLEDDGLQTVRALAGKIGASEPTIRSALADLIETGACRRWGSQFELVAEDVTTELMARIGAFPQMLRFRFAQGAMPRPPSDLVERAMLLLGPESPPEWAQLSLSGTPVALAGVPKVDLMGTPRLDLVAQVARESTVIDLREALRKLDPGLEVEPNVLKPAPVVITLARAKEPIYGPPAFGNVRCAGAVDVYLSLLDLDLVEQAHQYAEGVRP